MDTRKNIESENGTIGLLDLPEEIIRLVVNQINSAELQDANSYLLNKSPSRI